MLFCTLRSGERIKFILYDNKNSQNDQPITKFGHFYVILIVTSQLFDEPIDFDMIIKKKSAMSDILRRSV